MDGLVSQERPAQLSGQDAREGSGTSAPGHIQNGELQSTAAESNIPGNSASIQHPTSYFAPPRQNIYQSPYALGSSQPAPDLVTAPFSKETSEVIARVKAKGVSGLTHGSTEWETAKQAVRAEMDLKETNGIPTAANPTAARTGGRRGRGPRRRGSPVTHDSITLAVPASTVPIAPLGTPTGTPITPITPVTPIGTPTSGRGRGGRGGRPRGSRGGRGSFRGGKRKRIRIDGDGNESSSSEEITALPLQSRSGRKIFQASTSTPIIKIEPSEAEPSPLALTTPRSQPSTKIMAKKKIFKRTPGPSSVCKNCGRGHSPLSNAIVFCDGCNTPWHQQCHDPPIKKDYLLILDKDWFCADCVILREEKGKLQGKVPGDNMSLAEKRKYLQTLSHNTLVSLLLHASSLHPSLPIYPAKTYVPISPNTATSAAGANGLMIEEEEYYSEDELPYPKAGNGVQLPPESEDVGILVDDDTEVYSHRWEGIAEMLAEVAKLGIGSPARSGLGVRTGATGLGVRVGA